MALPVIGITVDNRENMIGSGQYESAIAYSQAVRACGGLPVLLPHDPDQASAYADLCDALVLTGGADPVMEQFGCETDGRARRMDQTRQAFELALLAAVDQRHRASLSPADDLPVLGVCLGMQLMALHRGATLDQYMPESMGEDAARTHIGNNAHPLVFEHSDSVIPASSDHVVSSHRQRISDAGQLRVVARAPDGTVEAIDDPARRFYAGVQWHPERGSTSQDDALNLGLVRRFVEAARRG